MDWRRLIVALWAILACRGGLADEAAAPLPPTALAANAPAEGKASLDSLLDLDLDELSKVRIASPAQQSAEAASVIDTTASELSAKTTTGELLEEAASVTVRRTSALNIDPRVRGYHSEQISATAEGVSQFKTRVDIDSLFSQIDPGIVRNVTVVDGPYTSLYGPGFAFLVAELAEPARYLDGPEFHGGTTFVYGDNGRSVYSREFASGGGADWAASASYGLRTGNDYRAGDGLRVPSSYRKWDGMFAASKDLAPGARIDFVYLRTEMNDVELPGVVYDLEHSHNDQFNLRYVLQDGPGEPERFVLQYWLNNTVYWGDALRPSKQASLYRDFFSLPSFDEYPVNTEGRGRSDAMGLRSLATFGAADAEQLTFGADWRRQRVYYREQNLNAAGQIVFDENVFGIPEALRDTCGLFTHAVVPWSERVDLTVGGRIDWSTTSVDAADPVVTQYAADAELPYYYDPGLDQPHELLGMAYATLHNRVTDRWTFSAGTGYAMRNPSLAELYSDEPYVPLVRFGNSYVTGQSDLEPERNWQSDLGLAYRGPKVRLAVRGFYANVENYIGLAPSFIDPSAPDGIDGGHALGRDFAAWDSRTDVGTQNENADTNQAGYFYTNLDCVALYGADLSLDVRVAPRLAIGGDVAYVEGTNFRPLRLVDYQLPTQRLERIDGWEPLYGIAPLNGRLRIRLIEPTSERWSLTLAMRVVDAQDRIARSLAEIRTPGFTTFDLYGYYQATPRLRLTLAVENLFDTAYTEHGSLAIVGRDGRAVFIPEPGINVFSGLEWTF